MKLLVLKVNKKSGIKMIQQGLRQIPTNFTAESRKITQLLVENLRLTSQLNRTKQDHQKLQVKYQKSLKQLALIVKANETLKKDYDELQLKIDSIAQQKAQITRSKIKQYIKKEIDDLNKTIQSLNDQKDRLQIDNNSLKNKVKTLLQEKSKILNQKENVQKKYSVLEAQLQSIVPEARGSNAKTKSVKELREKVRLVDQLQQAVHKLQEEKQQIQKDFEEKMQQIESLWHQWYQFQHELNQGQKTEIKLHDEDQQPLNQQRGRQKPASKKKRRRGSIIYEHGIKLLRGQEGQRKGQQKQVHFTHDFEQKGRELSEMRQNNRQLERENQNLRFQIQKMKEDEKVIQQLKTSCNKLKQEKLIAEQKLSQLRIQSVSRQKALVTKAVDKKDSLNMPQSSDDDLVSILKQLHGQLGPLRSQLITMKKLQSQQTQITSAQKANTQVKLIRLEKQLSFYKDHNETLKKQLFQLKSQKQLMHQYQSKITQLQQQKSTLQGKLIVMQTLKIADRTRVEGQTYHTLEEFEKRMKVLAKDSSILKDLQGNHLQQLVAMKAYILELDDKMKFAQLQHQKLLKKYAYTKEKLAAMSAQIKDMESQQNGKVAIYKEKIQAYDKLVSKLTAELQKNIEKNSKMHEKDSRQNSRNRKLPNGTKSSQDEIHKVITLYEQKMINMGEQIVRIRKDRDDYEEEVKDLRTKLNIKFKELNGKQRQIVLLKTETINLQNLNKVLERELADRTERQSSGFGKSKIASTVYDHQRNDTGIIYDESKEVKRVRDDYERHLMALNFKIEQLQEQVELFKRQNQQQQKSMLIATQKSKQYTRKENEIFQREQLLQEEMRALKDSYEQEQIVSIELVIQKHTQLINELKHRHSVEQQQMTQTIQQLYNELRLKNDNILKLELLKTQLQQNSHHKDLEIHNLNQAIAKNIHEMQQLNNLIRFNNYYIEQQKAQGRKKLEQKKTQQFNDSVRENMRLQNQLYEKNVYITSLQSTIYNLKLENQRLSSDFDIFHQKLQKMQEELKIKHSTIFNLENQMRKSSNLKDSAIIAKDSLIRSYENQIINLKHSIEDLKGINKFQQERNEGLIRELKQKLSKSNVEPQSSINQLQVNVSTPQQSLRPQESLQSGQSSIEENRRFIYDLQTKIGTLQSQLKYTQEQLLASSEEINRLNLKHELIPSNSSIASISYEEKMQLLEGQMLALRTTIFSLQNQIEQKEQVINELRQEIFNLKLQYLKSSDKNLTERSKKQEETETQRIDQSTSPRKPMMFDEPVIARFEYQIQELRNENEELQITLSQKQLQINLLNSQIERLNQYISAFKLNQGNKNQQKKSLESQQDQQKKQAQNIDQGTKSVNESSQRMQNVISQLKTYYESELYAMHQTMEHYESQLLKKNLKISELTRIIAEKELSPKSSTTQNHQSPDPNQLLKQIAKQHQLMRLKQAQSSDLQTLLTKYQSQENRSQENLALIVMLIAEVQSLRRQLQLGQFSMKKQQSESIESNKVKSVSMQQKEQEEESQKVDYGIIKDLQCSHEHLVNYQKLLHPQQLQTPLIYQDSNSDHSSSSPVTQTLVNQKLQSKLQISEPQSHQRTISIQHQQILSQYQTIDEMKLIEATSFPSESNGSVNNIQSNYSIKNPFKEYYRPAHSTYHPKSFQSDGHQKKLSQLSVPQQITEAGQSKEKSKIHTNLTTFGKISESHNVDSSYGSRGFQSNQNLPQKQNPNNSQYEFKFKNVNMIESVESTPNAKQQQRRKLQNQDEEKTSSNNFSFGKEERINQNPIQNRYIFQTNNLSLVGESSLPQETHPNTQNYYSSYMQHFPLTSTNSPYMQTNNQQLSPSFSSRANLPNSNSYISDQQSSRSGSQASSRKYLPTYNEGSSTYLSGNQNAGNGDMNMSQTKLSSTLDKTSSYQQYISKFL